LPVSPLGTEGEALAAEHLEALGYRVLDRDLKLPLGQIDLVALDGATLVFVEVKTRSGKGFGLPQEAVGWHKARKLRQLALSYLQRRRHQGPVRFDVVGIIKRAGEPARIEHIKNAIES
jgi:putative endonuclease